mmetsp:Transcript_115957/g.322936  ORF Transcript_115957/g.322936 Transcript_115957/m.322936 type:complete len:235 (-) Transcript_115957:770-1474(-)
MLRAGLRKRALQIPQNDRLRLLLHEEIAPPLKGLEEQEAGPHHRCAVHVPLHTPTCLQLAVRSAHPEQAAPRWTPILGRVRPVNPTSALVLLRIQALADDVEAAVGTGRRVREEWLVREAVLLEASHNSVAVVRKLHRPPQQLAGLRLEPDDLPRPSVSRDLLALGLRHGARRCAQGHDHHRLAAHRDEGRAGVALQLEGLLPLELAVCDAEGPHQALAAIGLIPLLLRHLVAG